MATKPNAVTEPIFLTVEDVMQITRYKMAKAYRIIQQMNKILAAENRIWFKGRITKDNFNMLLARGDIK